MEHDVLDVIMIIAAVVQALSTVIACITCWYMRNSTLPNIKIQTEGENENGNFQSFFIHHDNTCMAFIRIGIMNSANVGSVIRNVTLLYDGKVFNCEDSNTVYNNLKNVTINCYDDFNNNVEFPHFPLPINMPAYSHKDGFVVVPNFTKVEQDKIDAHIVCVVVGRKKPIVLPITLYKKAMLN